MQTKKDYLHLVGNNIKEKGFHLVIVQGKDHPRYAYSIGLKEKLGFELVFAGGYFFSFDQVFEIFNGVYSYALSNPQMDGANDIKISGLCYFSLRKVDSSWLSIMLLGVMDYYGNTEKIDALQIVPEESCFTLEIPNLSLFFDQKNIVWKWLNTEWGLQIPQTSKVVTNLGVLRGEAITEIARWEKDEWEMFTKNPDEIEKELIRIVPFCVILGKDYSIMPAMQLSIGQGLWRDSPNDEWSDWG